MGSDMQRQAVPPLRAEKPLVGTVIERVVAQDSGDTNNTHHDDKKNTDNTNHNKKHNKNKKTQTNKTNNNNNNMMYSRSIHNSCIIQRTQKKTGDKNAHDDVLAVGPSTDMGELARGQNMLVAFMPWYGYNFEDSILISERVVQEDRFTSIHIEEQTCVARDTKLGPEEITSDFPNVGEAALN